MTERAEFTTRFRMWLFKLLLLCAVRVAPEPGRNKFLHWLDSMGKIQTIVDDNTEDGEDFKVIATFEKVP